MQKLIKPLLQDLSSMFTGYFALVMSTGIISIGAWLMNWKTIGHMMFKLNIILYFLLFVLYVLRIILFPKDVIRDFKNDLKSAGFLTIVAATGILGSQFVMINNQHSWANVLYVFSLVSWLILNYSFFILMSTEKTKPNLEDGLNGIWLLIVVAIQSISILGVLIKDQSPFPKEIILFLSLLFFLIGCVLYLILITLIFYRLTFFNLTTQELAPPYWINMGAVAITTLAGVTLIETHTDWPVIIQIRTFLLGLSLMFWSIGSWWIPIVIALGIWKHLYKKAPILYDPQYWGLVFPLGMYAVCTLKLNILLKFPFLQHLSELFLYTAFIAWSITFFAMLKNSFKKFLKAKNQFNH